MVTSCFLTVGLNVEVAPELHHRIRVGAALRRKTIRAAVIEVLEREFPPVPESDHRPPR